MAELESRTGIALAMGGGGGGGGGGHATTALPADESGSFWMVDEPGEPEEESGWGVDRSGANASKPRDEPVQGWPFDALEDLVSAQLTRELAARGVAVAEGVEAAEAAVLRLSARMSRLESNTSGLVQRSAEGSGRELSELRV